MALPEPSGPLLEIVRGLHEEVVHQLRMARQVEHPGEGGRARESIMRSFLRRFVPGGLEIDTGFVVDCSGRISRQVDIVIHRNDYHPVLEVGGIKHFLVESVVAVIENKASIRSRELLREALANVRSVKSLDRSGGGRNYIVMDFHGQGPQIDASDRHHRVWTAIITEEGLGAETLLDELAGDMRAHPQHLWLDCYVAIGQFASRYLDVESRLLYGPEGADALVLTDPSQEGGEQPLVDFAVLLAHRLRHAAIVDYLPEHYFPISRKNVAGRRLQDL